MLVKSSNYAKRPRRLRKKDWALVGMSAPTAIMIFVFSYLPMLGLIIAFKKFNISKGILGSDWAGLENFKFFFKSTDCWIVLRNTIGMNFVFIFATLIVSVAIALILNEIKSRTKVKIVQTIMFFPYFVSWVVVSFMLYAFLNHNYGIINSVLSALGLKTIEWYSQAEYWPFILAFVYIWKNAGYNSVIYYASIIGIDETYYEAAAIDGATRRQATFKITLPLLKSVIICMVLLQIGKIMYSDFGLFYQVPRDIGALYATTNVLDTYIFRMLRVTGNIGVSAAVGLFQAVVGFVMIMTANLTVKRIDEESALF